MQVTRMQASELCTNPIEQWYETMRVSFPGFLRSRPFVAITRRVTE